MQSLKTSAAPEGPITRADVLDAQAVADLLGVSRRTVLRWAREGRIPSVGVGRTVLFLRSDVDAWIRSRRRGLASIGE
jgi:excisionase family DNA binding protein